MKVEQAPTEMLKKAFIEKNPQEMVAALEMGANPYDNSQGPSVFQMILLGNNNEANTPAMKDAVLHVLDAAPQKAEDLDVFRSCYLSLHRDNGYASIVSSQGNETASKRQEYLHDLKESIKNSSSFQLVSSISSFSSLDVEAAQSFTKGQFDAELDLARNASASPLPRPAPSFAPSKNNNHELKKDRQPSMEGTSSRPLSDFDSQYSLAPDEENIHPRSSFLVENDAESLAEDYSSAKLSANGFKQKCLEKRKVKPAPQSPLLKNSEI